MDVMNLHPPRALMGWHGHSLSLLTRLAAACMSSSTVVTERRPNFSLRIASRSGVEARRGWTGHVFFTPAQAVSRITIAFLLSNQRAPARGGRSLTPQPSFSARVTARIIVRQYASLRYLTGIDQTRQTFDIAESSLKRYLPQASQDQAVIRDAGGEIGEFLRSPRAPSQPPTVKIWRSFHGSPGR